MVYGSKKGFTIAELIIALTIVTIIATFNIVKIFTSVSDIKNKTIGKDAAMMVAESYEQSKVNNGSTISNIAIEDVLANSNVVKEVPTATIDSA
jgi:prepilin-type N-terminal cleavage/methylation domain-containing protein